MEEPGKAFKRGTVEAAGFTLDYAEAGPAAPRATIVSLPGSAGLEMSTAKDVLAGTYRVVEINPPGWGARDDLDRPMGQDELGKILAEAIGRLVQEPFYLLGTSMGGANTVWVAAAMPDKVLGIIHEGSMAPCRDQDLRMQMTPEQREQMAKAQEEGRAPPYPVPPPHPRKPWATEDYVRQQMTNRFRMFRWTQADMKAEAAYEVVRARKIPLLALLGDRDQILNLSQAEAYKDAAPHAQFEVVPEGEHDLQNTTPEAFVSHVTNFIDRTGHAR